MNFGSPLSSRDRFKDSKSSFAIKTSPLNSNFPPFRFLMFDGMESIVKIFCVISSPVDPSPLVAAYFNRPSSYRIDTATPSIFGSTVKVKSDSLMVFRNLLYHSVKLFSGSKSNVLISSSLSS